MMGFNNCYKIMAVDFLKGSLPAGEFLKVKNMTSFLDLQNLTGLRLCCVGILNTYLHE